MELQLQIQMNPALYLRDPEGSELGKKIVVNGIKLIDALGFEDFTFKKLAAEVGSTEASIYRYFENKHRLLTYITTWFWSWMEYGLLFHTNNVADPAEKIRIVIRQLTQYGEDQLPFAGVNKSILHNIAITEGDKSYLTRHVTADNRAQLFKPYKDLCHRIATIFIEYNAIYPFPHSLATTLIETAHHQFYFKDNLPKLTDFGGQSDIQPLLDFLAHLVFSVLDAGTKAKG